MIMASIHILIWVVRVIHEDAFWRNGKAFENHFAV